MARLQAKGVRWYWCVRYWYMDTDSGREARIAGAVVCGLIVIMQTVRMGNAVVNPAPVQQQQAVVWWVVALIVAVVAAIAMYALMPKVEAPKPTEGDAPTVEDGRATIIVDGEYWIDDEFILASKVVGSAPIKSGGKK